VNRTPRCSVHSRSVNCSRVYKLVALRRQKLALLARDGLLFVASLLRDRWAFDSSETARRLAGGLQKNPSSCEKRALSASWPREYTIAPGRSGARVVPAFYRWPAELAVAARNRALNCFGCCELETRATAPTKRPQRGTKKEQKNGLPRLRRAAAAPAAAASALPRPAPPGRHLDDWLRPRHRLNERLPHATEGPAARAPDDERDPTKKTTTRPRKS